MEYYQTIDSNKFKMHMEKGKPTNNRFYKDNLKMERIENISSLHARVVEEYPKASKILDSLIDKFPEVHPLTLITLYFIKMAEIYKQCGFKYETFEEWVQKDIKRAEKVWNPNDK